MFPYMLRYRVALRIVDLPPHIVNGGIDHYPSDPANQQHLHLLLIPHLEPAEIPEHLEKSVMHYLRRLLIRIYIPERDLDTQAIVLIVKHLLGMPVLLSTTGDYLNKFFQNRRLTDLPMIDS
jgi:hypothetical protein